MKTCRCCGRTLGLAEFPCHPGCKDGREGRCKTCKSAYMKSRRQVPEVRKRETETRRRWYENGGREIVRKNTLQYRKRTGYPGWSLPERRHARNLAQSAIRRGKLKRLPCEVCGIKKAESHHDDYTRPFEIRFLCNKHHKEADGAIRARP